MRVQICRVGHLPPRRNIFSAFRKRDRPRYNPKTKINCMNSPQIPSFNVTLVSSRGQAVH